ncbi:hypothetical protein H5410_020759 [Solanum commersonii]|uniref:Zinc finger PMZ-type domain-containing protein n=1 Tax=Solanum commersonii TaxID=4109 RepID=A0A9J5ZF67_SOLCO|nr:hypothetical protein H5410_020759 [Solanum commersonii]
MKADLHRVFELNVSEARCKRAKKEILEGLEGSFVDSYNKLEGYATELRSCNTGSDIVIDLSKEALSNEEFEDQLQEIKKVNGEAGQDLIDKYPPKAWCRAYLDTMCKNQAIDNNFTESFNAWILKQGADRHIVNLREKKYICRTWDLTGIPCPHAIKAMEHNKMLPKKEIHWYYSKEAALAVYKHKLQPVRGEPFWKCDHLHVIEPHELVKIVGRPKLMREREKDEVVKRQGGKQLTKKQGKQPAKQGKESGRGKKSYFPVAEDDDEDPRLRPRTISEEVFLTRLKKKQNPQEPIGSRVIGFRCDKFGVSEPTNLPIGPTGLTWNGQGAVTTNQLQKLRPRRG